MYKTVKRYYEIVLLVTIILSFFLFRREVFTAYVYLAIGSIIAVYFLPIRIIRAVSNINTKQTGLQVMSSLIIGLLIAASLIAVFNKHFPGLLYTIYALTLINAFFILYSLFKDQERRAFLLHLLMLLFSSSLIDLM